MTKPSRARKSKPQPNTKAQQRPSAGAQTNAPPDPFAAFRNRAEALAQGDETGLKALLSDIAREKYSEARADPIVRAAARATGIAFRLVKGLLARAAAELKRQEESAPEARKANLVVLQTERDVERARLWELCKDIAESKTLLADMERLIHRLGLVGESAAIRGTYIAGTSRLLRRLAISFLRRGAAASGKNIQINKVLSLFPSESVIAISSATPQSLIYTGEDENDTDALKHKIIAIGEAAVLARKANGDEHPMVPMLRTMLADGCLLHHIPVPQPSGPPKTLVIRRDGPMSLMLTSARANIEDEMLTRLLCSDADESGRQTQRIVIGAWLGKRETVSHDELARWVAFQKWLEIDKPPDGYDVVVPFARAIAKAHITLMRKNRAVAQLRVRRDASAFKAAIEASALIHKKRREADDIGRIVATFDDYEHAHRAFNPGMASLYDIKQAGAIAAALKAVIELAAGAPTALLSSESYKITVDTLRRKLGLASKETAAGRLEKLIDLGALEEDEEKRGRGRGSPRFYQIKKTSLEGDVADNVFPSVDAVREIFAGGGSTVQDVREKKQQQNQQDSRTSGSCPETTRSPDGDFLVASENHPDSKDTPNNSRAYPPVRLVHPTPSPSSLRDDAKKRGNARKPSGLTASQCIGAVGESGGTLTLWPDGTGFDTDLRSVADAPLPAMLLDAVSDNYDAVLTVLQSEAGLMLEQAEVRP